jgi:pyridoxal phosphate enzyme (YggS family)
MISENIQHVQLTIQQACERAGRNPADVTLIAVSKTHPAEAVLEAAVAGVQHFGENRVEEASIKIPAVNRQTGQALTWHMIGHIQSRKAREVAPLFGVVHSVDSLKLAGKLNAQAGETGRQLDVLLEMNISGEASKDGFPAHGWRIDPARRDEVVAFASQVMALPALRVRGLMTMAPIVGSMEAARPFFADLAGLREALQQELGFLLPDLSMGMTDDYPVAVEEGATMVRVGRAIFGERTK